MLFQLFFPLRGRILIANILIYSPDITKHYSPCLSIVAFSHAFCIQEYYKRYVNIRSIYLQIVWTLVSFVFWHSRSNRPFLPHERSSCCRDRMVVVFIEPIHVFGQFVCVVHKSSCFLPRICFILLSMCIWNLDW